MSRQKIFLYTSDIAAYIGQNRYDIVTPFERLWKRSDSVGYNNIINRSKEEVELNKVKIIELEKKNDILNMDLSLKKITKKKYIIEIKKIQDDKNKIIESNGKLESDIECIDLTQKDKLIKVLGENNIKNLESASIETENKREAVEKLVNDMNISDEQKNSIKRETESFINKTHGTLKEDTAIEMYEKKFNIKLDTSQQFNKILVKTTDKYEWYICGKVDGLYVDKNPDASYIVEVKNRTRGFFSTLRDYEKTQIQLYMHMLNLKTSKLVEKFKDKIRITVIYKDLDYVNDVLQYIDIFITNFEKSFINNYDKKLEFVNSTMDHKSLILKKMYLNAITAEINKKILDNIKDEDSRCLIDDLD
jgi:hypothetical protein